MFLFAYWNRKGVVRSEGSYYRFSIYFDRFVNLYTTDIVQGTRQLFDRFCSTYHKF